LPSASEKCSETAEKNKTQEKAIRIYGLLKNSALKELEKGIFIAFAFFQPFSF
jgi:hypothetical protein